MSASEAKTPVADKGKRTSDEAADETALTVPSGFSFATTTSPPIFLLRFQAPWRAIKMALRYSAGNIFPV